MEHDFIPPCGAGPTEPGEGWKDEVACNMIGCHSCKNCNGTEYFKINVKKALALWTKKQLEDMNRAQP